MKNYGERLKAFIEWTGLTENNFSKEVGLDRPDKVYSLIKGKTNYPHVSLSEGIKKRFPSVNLNWLDGGSGEMLINDDLEERLKVAEKGKRSAEASLKMAQLLLWDRLTEEERQMLGFND